MKQTTISHLPKSIQTTLQTKNITQLTPIQSQAIEHILTGENLIAQAKTGSGKTLAFAIPLIMQIKPNNTNPKVLILAPTRELCLQIANVFRFLGKDLSNLKIVSLIGGEPLRGQIKSMQQGVDVIIATPGRLKDHLFRETINLSEIKSVVLDEGDKMIDMGFYDDIDSILKQIKQDAQILLFSATFPQKLENLAKSFLSNAVVVKTDTTHEDGKITTYGIAAVDLMHTLLQALWHYAPEKAIVFCNTKEECDTVCENIKNYKISTTTLHGNLEQLQRQEALLKLSNGSTRVIVATDLASRGLDIDDVDIVISFGLPEKKETFTHRIGRTARGQKDGKALLIYPPYKERYAKELATELKIITLDDNSKKILQNDTNTLRINGGRKDKISAKDILGALTKDAKIDSKTIGKIDITTNYSYVAIKLESFEKAITRLQNGKIKGKKYKIVKI